VLAYLAATTAAAGGAGGGVGLQQPPLLRVTLVVDFATYTVPATSRGVPKAALAGLRALAEDVRTSDGVRVVKACAEPSESSAQHDVATPHRYSLTWCCCCRRRLLVRGAGAADVGCDGRGVLASQSWRHADGSRELGAEQ